MAMNAASSTDEKLIPPLLMAREHDAAIHNSETCCDTHEPMPPFILAGHANVDSPAIGSCETNRKKIKQRRIRHWLLRDQ